MRDPRLREIEFLTAVERGTTTSVTVPLHAEGGEHFGADAITFRRMVAHLVMVGAINGPSGFPAGNLPHPSAALGRIEQAKSVDVCNLLMGREITLAISHSGLIRLVELREALDRGRMRDPFGILFDQRYWERDLFVRLLDASATEPLALIAIDLDHFKTVNDTLGHDEGDLVLKACFQRVLDTVRDLGESYRRGGDEVLVFIPKTTLAAAQALAEKLRAGFEEEFRE